MEAAYSASLLCLLSETMCIALLSDLPAYSDWACETYTADPASSHRYISVGPDIASSVRMDFCHHSLAPIVVVHLSFDVGYFQHLDDPNS